MIRLFHKQRTPTRSVPWYQSIMFKQASVFLIMMALILSVFLYAFSNFQADSVATIAETTLSHDSLICNDLFTQISDIEYQVHGLYNEGSIYLLSDMWNRYDIVERSQRIISIQDHLKWLGSQQDLKNEYRMYLLRHEIKIYDGGYQEISTSEMDRISSALENNRIIGISDGAFYVYVKSLSEGSNRTLRFLCEVKIPVYRFSRMMSDICSDEDTGAILLTSGEIYQQKNLDSENTSTRITCKRSNCNEQS